MYDSAVQRSRRVRRSRVARAVSAFLLLLIPLAGFAAFGGGGRASADIAVAQTYYTPFEAQQFITVLRTLNGDAGCCTSPVISTVSITSGADGNTIFYDHFEDGYEADPVNPVQASTLTLSLDSGAVWSQTSSVPVDVGGLGVSRGAGNYYDGRDRISSTHPIAVTQSGYTTGAGTLLASDAAVLDLDKSGFRYDIPAGQNADYNQVFEYTGLVIVATADATSVDLDMDADGVFESTVLLDEGEIHVLNGGVMLGAVVQSDKRVSTYVTTGDIGSNYESRFFELYPTDIWANNYLSPVGAVAGQSGTRVFLFNPGAGEITIDAVTGSGGVSTVTLAAGAQGSFLMPVDAGARFSSQGGEPFYAFQMVTTEGTNTSAYDWGYTLVPGQAVTPSVIIPYGAGSEGLTNNYSPVWVSPTADTTLYVDRDGDPSTGALTDPSGNQYDFSCAITAYASITVYDDGTANCYLPSDTSAAGGDRDMTGARLYTLDGTGLVAAWGQRPGYTAGLPALDMGTAILPFPVIVVTKGAVLSTDLDSDGLADPGDEITYSITTQNLGIIDISGVTLVDETPAHTSYVAGSTYYDGILQADDVAPFTSSPIDADSPTGSFTLGTVDAGASRVLEVTLLVGSIPFGVSEVANLATITTSYGPTTAINRFPADVPPLQIVKSSAPSASPVASGDTITYTIQVANNDDVAQTGIDVTDVLAAGTTYVPGSAAADIEGAPIGAGDPPALVSGVTLEPDEVLTITFDVTIDAPMAAGTGEFTNTATVVSVQHPTPVSDDAADPAGPLADLSLVKVDDEVAPLSSGDTLVYTLTVTNSGPDEAAAVVVTDTLPAGVTFVPGASDPRCVEAPAGTLTCSLGDMGLTSTSLDLAVTIDAAASDATITNTATVTSSTPEGVPGDETDTEDTAIQGTTPVVSVTKDASVPAVSEPGDWVTFTVTVSNASAESVSITSLMDDVFGDLLDAANPEVDNNTCASLPATMGGGAELVCSFDGLVSGNGAAPDHVNTVTFEVTDDDDNPASAQASAIVAIDDVTPTIVVTKKASSATVVEPGDWVTFAIGVENTSTEAVTVTALVDDVFGDLLDAGNPNVAANTCEAASLVISGGDTLSCSFDGFVAGGFGDPNHLNTVTANAEDDEGNPVSEEASAAVGFDDVVPVVSVTKVASVPAVSEPGDWVTFTVTVSNDSAESVSITSLMDDVFGDLLDAANSEVENNTCASLPATLGVGASLACSFDGLVSGNGSAPDHVNTVTFEVTDDDDNPASAQASATVAIDDAAPTATVHKDADSGVVTEPGGVVTFTVTIDNTGVEVLTIDALVDSVFGDLRDAANPAVTNNTCPLLGGQIPAGGWVACWFDADLEGLFGDPDHEDVVTATLSDDEGTEITPSDNATVAFGPSNSSVGGVVFEDLDRDGIMDPDEVGLEGMLVTVTGSTGLVSVVITDSDGNWSTPALPGATTIEVDSATAPSGYTLTTANATQVVTAVAGELVSSEEVGYGPGLGSIAGTLFLDLDGDPDRDSYEPSLAGIDVELLDGGVVIATATSSSDGSYQFEGLVAGSYTVRVVAATVPAGLVASTDYDGGADGSAVAVVVADEVTSDVDFGHRGTARVGDTVWLDEDEDGVIGEFEEPIEDAELTLTWWGLDGIEGNDDDYTFPAATTDEDGLYEITHLPPGGYTMSVDTTAAAIDLEATTATTLHFNLTAGMSYLGADFGFVADEELPFTGLEAENLLLASALMIALGALVFADVHKRERKFRLAMRRIDR